MTRLVSGFIFWSLALGLLFSIGLRTGGASLLVAGPIVFIFFISVVFYFRKKVTRRMFFASGFLFVSVFFGGWFRADVVMVNLAREDFVYLYGQEVEVYGVVVSESDERIANTKLTIAPTEICSLGECVESDQKILASVAAGVQVQYGDVVWVRGKLQRPENFTNDAGREFDYINYLAKDGVRGLVYYPEFEIIDSGPENLRRRLYAIKKSMVAKLNQIMPQPEGALGAGIVFGEKQALGEELSDQFRKTGLMHIVVLSGYNVTIVADALVRSLAFLGVGASYLVGALGIVLFALMVGAGPTIVRASIMAGLVLLARYLGRPAATTRSLILAGVIMLVHNPLILWYDISFQLSFLATLGLIYVYPIVEKKLHWVSSRFQLREHLSATLSAQIAVLPLLVIAMGEVSVIAPLANVLVLPLIPIAMLFTFLTATLGFVSLPLAQLGMLPAAGVLSYALWVTELLAKLPFAIVRIGI